MIRKAPFALAFVLVFGCSDAGASGSPEASEGSAALAHARTFIDARSYLTAPEHIEGWYLLTRTLRENFDAICGDTFCEGDYQNYESLGFRCSVNRGGLVGSCVWMFAASSEEVVPRTGDFRVQFEHWHCRMPIARGTRLTELLTTLSSAGREPLFAPLPGTQRSLYDGLVECL